VKAWLSQAGVSFVVRNVDDDLSAYTELTSRGFRTVPVTTVGAAAVVGFAPARLIEALSAQGLWPGDPGTP
jgi:Glutaredoxin